MSTVVAYALGTPRAAALRGGDCRARDLDQDRNVHGPHRFAATTHCQISNGMLRLTVGASASAPSLTVEGWRGAVVVGDVYVDTYVDLYGGSIGTPAWLAVGTITIDSPSVSALLTAVQIAEITPEMVVLRLVAPVIGDTYVRLERGERMIHIHHGQDGNRKGPAVSTSRRVRWTATPSPTGTTATKRVEEVTPAAGMDGLYRFVAAIDTATVNAGDFSATATGATTARFGAGVGIAATRDRPGDMHQQLLDASRPRLVVA